MSFIGRFFKRPEPEFKPFAETGQLTVEQRGVLAEQALSNPVISEAFRELERRLFVEWKSTLDDQTTEREIAFDRLKAVEYVKGVLTGYANQALLEREAQKQKEDEKQWMMQQS